MMKIPLARAKAATASFPTLLEDGSVFLRIRRTHATGGSNSTADGGPDLVALLVAVGVVAVAADGVAAEGVAAPSVESTAAAGVPGVSVVVADASASPPPTSILSSVSGAVDVVVAMSAVGVLIPGWIESCLAPSNRRSWIMSPGLAWAPL